MSYLIVAGLTLVAMGVVFLSAGFLPGVVLVIAGCTIKIWMHYVMWFLM